MSCAGKMTCIYPFVDQTHSYTYETLPRSMVCYIPKRPKRESRLSALEAWTSFVHFTLTMGLSENGLVGPFQGFQMNFGLQGLKII